MRYLTSIRKVVCLAGCSLLMFGATHVAFAQDESIEKSTRIHRLDSNKRAIYDAFTYVNRIPEKVEERESPVQLAGRIFGRLGNQEGRIQLKLPPGMTKDDYLSFKKFFRYEGAQAANCAACHVPAEFNDDLKHVVSKGGEAKATPSLRNLAGRGLDLEKIILDKLTVAKQKQAGTAGSVDDEYLAITITAEDVPGLVSYLKLLNDTPEEGFRDLILNAELLNTEGFWNE